MKESNMPDTHIVIIGTGSEGRIVADIFTAMGVVVLGFMETDPERTIKDVNDINVFSLYDGPDAKKVLKDPNVEFFVAVGDISVRMDIYERVSNRTKRPSMNALHPLSWQSPYATLGFGNFFNAASVVNANSVIGDMNHFHSGVSVETDAMIGNYCNFNSGVRIGANARIADEVFIGTGAIIHPGVELGKGCMIGAGSVVLRSVAAGKKVFGNPAAVV
jgi:sugar O-acyltransferase (sialic acid O-acetyltransferase NeuD family)